MKHVMARLAGVVLALAASGGGAGAAAACAPGTLASYLGTACEVGGITFSDFAVEGFPGVDVQPIAPAGIAVNPGHDGLRLAADPLTAGAGELLGLRLLFTVTAADLRVGRISIDPSARAGGDGVITALLDAGAGRSAIAYVIDADAQRRATFAAAPASFFDVFVEIGIDGGTAGSAALGPGLAEFGFRSPIPEPARPGLLMLGVALLAWRVRRRA